MSRLLEVGTGEGVATDTYPTIVARRSCGSVKMSNSSVLRVENSETTAPSSPAWNQCRVLGGTVHCSPGHRTTSWRTVYVASRPAGGLATGLAVGSPST